MKKFKVISLTCLLGSLCLSGCQESEKNNQNGSLPGVTVSKNKAINDKDNSLKALTGDIVCSYVDLTNGEYGEVSSKRVIKGAGEKRYTKVQFMKGNHQPGEGWHNYKAPEITQAKIVHSMFPYGLIIDACKNNVDSTKKHNVKITGIKLKQDSVYYGLEDTDIVLRGDEIHLENVLNLAANNLIADNILAAGLLIPNRSFSEYKKSNINRGRLMTSIELKDGPFLIHEGNTEEGTFRSDLWEEEDSLPNSLKDIKADLRAVFGLERSFASKQHPSNFKENVFTTSQYLMMAQFVAEYDGPDNIPTVIDYILPRYNVDFADNMDAKGTGVDSYLEYNIGNKEKLDGELKKPFLSFKFEYDETNHNLIHVKVTSAKSLALYLAEQSSKEDEGTDYFMRSLYIQSSVYYTLDSTHFNYTEIKEANYPMDISVSRTKPLQQLTVSRAVKNLSDKNYWNDETFMYATQNLARLFANNTARAVAIQHPEIRGNNTWSLR